MQKRKHIYGEMAEYYDLIYASKDYKREAEEIKKIIQEYKKSEGTDLLEIATGTGKHIQFLADDFVITATDKSRKILDIARKKNKNLPITFNVVDMIDFKLQKEFDVIICLFSSIGYTRTKKNLKKTIKNFSQHLKKGGVVIIEPWLTKNNYNVGVPHMATYDDKNIKIARLNISRIEGSMSTMNMHYLIAERDKGVRYFIDTHKLGLFETNYILKTMKENGLSSFFLKDKKLCSDRRGVIIGVKE